MRRPDRCVSGFWRVRRSNRPTVRFLLDEHIPSAIVRQLQRSYPQEVDVARVVGVGLMGASDPEVLAWAAEEKRILISRDKATLTNFAYERIEQGLPMPSVGVFSRLWRAVDEAFPSSVSDSKLHQYGD